MANQDALSLFVRDALVAGKTRAEISAALARAGWSVSEVHDALGAWDETPFSPPIPRPVATVSARDFFVYTLTFGLLLAGAINLVLVLQALVDLAFAEENYGATRQIRWGVSVLIVTAPLYLWLTLRERGRLAQDPALYRSAMRKWLTYIALLLAAMTLLGDLIATVFALLTGDLTGQFLIKALIVMIVAGGIFLFYVDDIRRGDQE
ncbi:DUF5671 domain-containing protein [Roseobacter sp. GAI101]|uniref:DUF5671 domain-containing protein n=1 Tax=Roseobacter sp. (strain GAI101) TaxID=391589 RepID=UPI0002FCE78D|nr:DUF5671 domain-containing protein [Roseobacter sp. GAI101]